MSKFTIIIPTYNNLSLLMNCVYSIYNNTANFDLIVVNNGSNDGTFEWLNFMSNSHDNFLSINSNKNIGFSAAINIGLTDISTEFICILNDDTICTPGWLTNLYDCYLNAPKYLGIKKVGFVGPVSNSVSGRQCLSGYSINPDNFIEFSQGYTLQNKNNFEVADFISGFCMFFSSSLISEIGFFDESFGLGGFEDNDLIYRAALSGYRSVFTHGSFVYHFGSSTLNRPEFSHLRNGLSNYRLFLDKYKFNSTPSLCTSFLVKNPLPCFYDSIEQASSYSDFVSITIDKGGSVDLNHPSILLKNVHLFSINHKTTEVQRRNIAIENAKTFDPDWILSLDSDEMLEDKCDYSFMHRLISHPNPSVKYIAFPFFNFWNDFLNWRVDGVFGEMVGPRLFKCFPDQILFSNHPEGYHVPHCPHATPEGTRFANTKILHYGYVDPDIRELKYNFYSSTDSKPDSNMIGNDDYSHIISPSVTLHQYSGSQTIDFQIVFGGEDIEFFNLIDSVYCAVDSINVLSTCDHLKCKVLSDFYGLNHIVGSFDDDFSKLRNRLLQNCHSDWVFYLDPDEALHPMFLPNLQRLIDDDVDAFLFSVRNLHKDGQPSFTDTVRLFRYFEGMKFNGLVHENLDNFFSSADFRIAEMPFELIHFGYLNPDKSEDKSAKLYKKLAIKSLKKNNKDPISHFNLALCYQHEGNLSKAMELYDKAAELEPKYYHPRLQLAILNAETSLRFFYEIRALLPENHRLSNDINLSIDYLSNIVNPSLRQVH